MAYSIKIVLPNDLRSEILRAEFLDLGENYVNKRSSDDPSYDLNKTTLKFKFEIRDVQTRSTVYTLTRIKTLYLSNDPEFNQSSTFVINSFPTSEYNDAVDYTLELNHKYFYDTSLDQIASTDSTSGSGYFIVENWPLSANGGLSTVYIKAILEVNNEEVTYPNTGGIFDQIYWEGQVPTTPSQVEFSSLKSGWVGTESLVTFKNASDQSSSNNAISSYLGSIVEVKKLPSSWNLISATDGVDEFYTSLIPDIITSGSTSLNYLSHRYSRTGSYTPGPANSHTYTGISKVAMGATSTLTSINKGLFYDGQTALSLTSTNNGFYTQTKYNLNTVSVGTGYTISFFSNVRTSLTHGQQEYITRIDISDISQPKAYFYATSATGEETSNFQETPISAHLIPKILQGGVFETYVQLFDDTYQIIETYFTENQNTILSDNQDKISYLMARSQIIQLNAASNYYTSFGCFMNGSGTAGIQVQELVAAGGRSIIAADLGDCKSEDINGLNFPISLIDTGWNTYFDEEMRYSTYVNSLTLTKETARVVIPKCTFTGDSGKVYQELQFLKPSLSNRAKLSFTFLHQCDEMYVAFSPKINQRLANEIPIGLTCDPDFAYADQGSLSPAICVNFNATKNEISVTQRNDDNTLSYYVLRSYKPQTSSNDNYTVEILDFNPEGIPGTKQRTAADGTWVCIRRNSNIEGYIQLSRKLATNEDGLGYYCAIGFRESDYQLTSNNYIYTVDFRSLPGIEKEYFNYPETIRSFSMAKNGVSKSKIYLGQTEVSSSTDFQGFNYKTDKPYDNTPINVRCATTGENLASITALGTIVTEIDGVMLSNVAINEYILIKDQIAPSENRLYKKTSPTQYIQFTGDFDYKELYVTDGDINAGTIWYPIRTGSIRKFYTTSWLRQIEINSISSFMADVFPELFEFKLQWERSEKPFEYEKLKVKFLNNDSANGIDLPGTELSPWFELDISSITSSSFVGKSNNDLVQLLCQHASFIVDRNTKYWIAISTPMGCSLAESNGFRYNSGNAISSGSYTGWNLAPGLWYKLFAKYSTKFNNTEHLNYQQFRVSALSHSGLSGNATNLSLPVKTDIYPPVNATSYTSGARPLLSLTDKSTVRTATFKISATDSDSGILAFRFAKETDYGIVSFEPWQGWNTFTNYNGDNLYTVYLHGSSRYDFAGAVNNIFQGQNIGFSGSRKVWVQLMDYAGNISESYPQAFVAQSIAAVDTEAPYGTISFYNLEENKEVLLTNKVDSWIKLNASDLVSGVKDFKYRRVYENGPSDWSNWFMYDSYTPIKFTDELDGVKRIEIAFRDYGNNITQPEMKWNKVLKIKK